MKQINASVHGRVQGVFFRDYTRREALKLGLTGWVKNDWDGSVRVTAVGDKEGLKALVEFLHRGSPQARVSRVDVEWSETNQVYDGFEVRW
jgi:acylphosphatase